MTGEAMNYTMSAATNVGSARPTNQDGVIVQYAVKESHTFLLAAVCDGMGGLEDGEVASATVTLALKQWFDRKCAEESVRDIHSLMNDLADTLGTLNEHLKEYEVQRRTLIVTTLSCLLALDDACGIFHIGDSRIYRIDTALCQLTTDHTVVARAVAEGTMTMEEAAVSADRSKLTQCFGASKRYEPEIFFDSVKPNTTFLICSDGFRHRLTEQELQMRFSPSALQGEQRMQFLCDQAIQDVMRRGEKDNISVVLVKAD